MPHLVILYTANLDADTDMTVLCRSLADTMLAQRDEAGLAVFPPGGTRVLAFPASHYAVSDGGAAGRAAGGNGDYAFVYLNLRIARGRSDPVKKAAGDALMACARAHFATLFEQRHLGITLQVDEGQEVFDAKHSNIHPLFKK
ncbi:MAG: 5-carboxymethyl-2-hydroxymuconate delta-isomerase [Burkholderiaceae bacterium]|jgi:5-carboxymethyl-2-hydroxymuconate isomerase|nr:MAG: 5-carboxymethyl-2-hydroxymuconate delta-isomerase [Burkholderiaceae bacterium]